MTYKEFEEVIREKVQELAGIDFQVSIQDYKKNNDTTLRGMVILREDCRNISPTIYLGQCYEMFKDGMVPERIAQRILDTYFAHMPQEEVDLSFLMDFERAKDRIVYRLVNWEMNKDLLSDLPHKRFLDLAVSFYYDYRNPEIGEGMIQIHNAHMEMWGVGVERLMRLADFNTPQLMPAQLYHMEDMLTDILDEESVEEMQCLQRESGRYLYVLSNNRHCHGASAILYPGVLAESARRLKGSFYILPCSIHECILTPDRGEECAEQLHEMIVEVNRSQVLKEEVLSDYAYRYDADARKIMEMH